MLGLDPEDEQMAQQAQAMIQSEQSENDRKRGHAKIKAHYLNWLQETNNKKGHARMAINEAIVKGLDLQYEPQKAYMFLAMTLYSTPMLNIGTIFNGALDE